MELEVKELLQKQREICVEKLQPNLEKVAQLQRDLLRVNEIVRTLQNSIKQIDEAIAAVNKVQEQTSMARPTIIQVVLEILEHAPNGLTAKEIMTEINSRGLLGEPIRRHSLSPQLSRLKDRDKKIELRGDRWHRLPDAPTLFPRNK